MNIFADKDSRASSGDFKVVQNFCSFFRFKKISASLVQTTWSRRLACKGLRYSSSVRSDLYTE